MPINKLVNKQINFKGKKPPNKHTNEDVSYHDKTNSKKWKKKKEKKNCEK